MQISEELLNLFGLKIKSKVPEKELSGSLAIDMDVDGGGITSSLLSSAGAFGTYLDTDGQIKTEVEAIRKYREISQFAEVDIAIQEIINEAIPQEQDTKLIKLNLDNLDDIVSDNVKDKITDAFDVVLKLLDYEDKGVEYFKRFYIDGRLPFQIIVDKKNTKDGIQKLVLLDSQNIKKMRDVTTKTNAQGAIIIDNVEEYYIYNENGFGVAKNIQGTGSNSISNLRISPDAIIYVTSGLVDSNSGMILSHLNKAIRPINQLKMLEDATVIYFIARAPERRVFYVDVGNLPKLKAEQYLKDIANRYRNKIVYDAKTGDVKNDKKYMCLAMDTKVPLLDGRTLTITEIAEEHKAGKELWAYSCDPTTGAFEPGLISWAGVTRKNAKVVRLTLDNGKEIVCTPDHKFPTWNNGFIEAKDLPIGESMIPHYTKQEYLTGKNTKTKLPYLQIFENDKKKWTCVHRAVSKWKDINNIQNEFVFGESHEIKKTVHHVNFDKNDNSPSNLVRMNSSDHMAYHANITHNISPEARSAMGKKGGAACYAMRKGIHGLSTEERITVCSKAGKVGGYMSSTTGKSQENLSKGREVLSMLIADEEWNDKFRESQKLGWTEEKREVAAEHAKKRNLSKQGNDYLITQYKDADSELSKNHATKYTTQYPQSIVEGVKYCAKQKMTVADAVSYINSDTVALVEFESANSTKVMVGQKDYSKLNKYDIGRISNLVVSAGGYSQLKESMEFRNHKITKIEWLDETIDTGCLTIDSEEKYHGHHTFALSAGIYCKNSMLEDFWMPRRDGGKGTEITTLQGAQNITGYLDSLSWFKEKMYEALNIPKSRLKEETGFNIGQSQNISRDEVKFQKFIDRLRNRFGQLLIDSLKTQLILTQVCNTEEWNEIKQYIKLDFQKDNFFSELKNQEIMTSRFTMIQQLDDYLQKYVSKEWVQRNVLMMADEDIEQESARMKKEKSDISAQPNWKIQGQFQQDQQAEMMQQQMDAQDGNTDQQQEPQNTGQVQQGEPAQEYDPQNYRK